MNNKKNLYTIKKFVSCILVLAMLTATAVGCTISFENNSGTGLNKDDVQADVDRLLGSHNPDMNSDEAESDGLVKETVEVENEPALGRLITSSSDDFKFSEDFTILEIIPNPEYTAFGYLIGGAEPVDKYALDAMINNEIGLVGSAGVQLAKGPGSFNENKSHIFGNGNDAGSNMIYTTSSYNATGYMEKIAYEERYDKRGEYPLGGTYALKYDFTKEDREKGIRRFNEELVFVSEYANLDSYKDNDTGLLNYYEMEKYEIGTKEVEVLDDNGDKKLLLDLSGNPVPELDDNNQPKVDDSGNPVYKYETQTVSIYDFRQPVSGKDENCVDRNAFCWIWHEVMDESELPSVDDSSTFSRESFVEKYKDTDIPEIPDGTRIVINESDGFQKFRVYNNEMFLLSCLGLGDKSHANKGLFSTVPREAIKGDDASVIASGIDVGNLQALDTYYEGDNSNRVYGPNFINNTLDDVAKRKIRIISKKPSDVGTADVDEADLIVLAAAEGGVYQGTRNIYMVEHETGPEPVEKFEDDINFYVFRDIYEKVITNKVAIACSRGAGGTSGYTNTDFKKNIGRLMLLMFCFYRYDQNWNLSQYKEVGSDLFASFYIRRLADACHQTDRFKNSDNRNSVVDGRVITGVGDKNNRPCDRFYVIENDANEKWLSADDMQHYGWLVKVLNIAADGSREIQYVEEWNTVFEENFPQLDGYGVGKDGNQSWFPKLFHDYYDDFGRYRFRNDFLPGVNENMYCFPDDNQLLTDPDPNNPNSNWALKQIVQTSVRGKQVGDIDFVGANLGNDNGNRKYPGGFSFDVRNKKDHTYEEEFDNVSPSERYQFNFETYDYVENGKTKTQKVLYLNEYEFEIAKEHGLNLYALIEIEDNFDMTDTEPNLYNESKTFELPPEEYEKKRLKFYQQSPDRVGYNRVELELRIKEDFFQKIDQNNKNNDKEPKLPLASKDGLFTVTVKVTAFGQNGKSNQVATGTDTLRIVVRDMFDYD